ncbi:S-adenosyl-L-homocysteine hydrolase-domain-containing protein, partial [Mycena galopus ATCC 62051]
DVSLTAFGRKEIEITEVCCRIFFTLQPSLKTLKGACIAGCLHMYDFFSHRIIQTAVLKTLIHLGAEVTWSSCNIFSTPCHAAAHRCNSRPVFHACTEQTIAGFASEKPLDRILDDGEKLSINGVTTTGQGVHHLYKVFRDCKLKIPTINVNDSVTPSSTTIMAAASRSSTISSTQPMSCSLFFLALEMSARAAPSLCAPTVLMSSSPKSTPSTPCRLRWPAMRSPSW